jgi:hypothetical protein
MNPLVIKVEPMNEDNMHYLESLGLIERLMPSRKKHRLNVEPGEGRGEKIYESKPMYGSHTLYKCTIDYPDFTKFAIHPDNEEFILLGGIDEKDLLLLIAYDTYDVFIEKYNKNQLESKDFICLKCVFNDPNLSFFVMKKNVPHGEATIGNGLPSTFYVTEGSHLPLQQIHIDHLKIQLDLSLLIKEEEK